MSNPLVSILMPTYEPQEGFLKETMESLLAQTETDWELIIHDDASSANVQAMLEPYLHDERIHFKRNAYRAGIGGNWNACLRLATAPLVQFLFQDDLWKPRYLERGIQIMNTHPNIGFVAADHAYQMEDGNESEEWYASVRAIRREELGEGVIEKTSFLRRWIDRGLTPNIIGEPSFVLLRRELMKKVGTFSVTMPQFLDAEYWLRCLQHADGYCIAEELGAFRVHGKGASAVNSATGRGVFDRYRTLKSILPTLPPEVRATAKSVLERETASMALKFFDRYGPRGTVHYTGREDVRGFVMKHPIYSLKTFIKFLSKK